MSIKVRSPSPMSLYRPPGQAAQRLVPMAPAADSLEAWWLEAVKSRGEAERLRDSDQKRLTERRFSENTQVFSMAHSGSDNSVMTGHEDRTVSCAETQCSSDTADELGSEEHLNTASPSSEKSEECFNCRAALGNRKFNPRHRCRLCNRTVCGACSPSSLQLETGGQLWRACTPCVTIACKSRFTSTRNSTTTSPLTKQLRDSSNGGSVKDDGTNGDDESEFHSAVSSLKGVDDCKEGKDEANDLELKSMEHRPCSCSSYSIPADRNATDNTLRESSHKQTQTTTIVLRSWYSRCLPVVAACSFMINMFLLRIPFMKSHFYRCLRQYCRLRLKDGIFSGCFRQACPRQ